MSLDVEAVAATRFPGVDPQRFVLRRAAAAIGRALQFRMAGGPALDRVAQSFWRAADELEATDEESSLERDLREAAWCFEAARRSLLAAAEDCRSSRLELYLRVCDAFSRARQESVS
jgi:hypothetical protein